MKHGTIDQNLGVDLDRHADIPNQKSSQYWGNELPWPRGSALSEFPCL